VIGHVDERLKEFQQTDTAYVEQINGLLKKEGVHLIKVVPKVKHLLWALVTDYGMEA
jgi:succinate dehydrogenase / fumarate reductase cytochrome b subunit